MVLNGSGPASKNGSCYQVLAKVKRDYRGVSKRRNDLLKSGCFLFLKSKHMVKKKKKKTLLIRFLKLCPFSVLVYVCGIEGRKEGLKERRKGGRMQAGKNKRERTGRRKKGGENR